MSRHIQPSLKHLPAPLFASVMGIGGLGLAWRQAGVVLDVPPLIGELVLGIAGLIFATIALGYIVKAFRYPSAVREEFNHPIRVAFFPAATIGLLIIAAALIPWSRPLALLTWSIATLGHLVLALVILNRWITRNWEINTTSPAWFIPIVGTILVPIAGVELGQIRIAWMFFAVGMLFWLILFAIVLYRIIFHDQMPQKILPTLFILLAPPAVGMVSYLQLNGGSLDPIAEALFGIALFTALLLATMAKRFLQIPFALSWWAYTFPSAAFAVAALLYHHLVGGPYTFIAAWLILILATLIILRVSWKTTVAALKGKLLLPEE